jgi:hypothetical protein
MTELKFQDLNDNQQRAVWIAYEHKFVTRGVSNVGREAHWKTAEVLSNAGWLVRAGMKYYITESGKQGVEAALGKPPAPSALSNGHKEAEMELNYNELPTVTLKNDLRVYTDGRTGLIPKGAKGSLLEVQKNDDYTMVHVYFGPDFGKRWFDALNLERLPANTAAAPPTPDSGHEADATHRLLELGEHLRTSKDVAEAVEKWDTRASDAALSAVNDAMADNPHPGITNRAANIRDTYDRLRKAEAERDAALADAQALRAALQPFVTFAATHRIQGEPDGKVLLMSLEKLAEGKHVERIITVADFFNARAASAGAKGAE